METGRLVGRRGEGERSGVNLAKAVIKLISHLEDARMYRRGRGEKEIERSLALFLPNGLNYQGSLGPVRAGSRPLATPLPSPPLFPGSTSHSYPRRSSGYLLGFYLWTRPWNNRPSWPMIRSRTAANVEGRNFRWRLALLLVFRRRSKALRVIRSGIIFCRVLFQFINKDS